MVLFQHAAGLTDWDLIENDEAFVFTLATYNENEETLDQDKCDEIYPYFERIRGTEQEYCSDDRDCDDIIGYQIDVLIRDPEQIFEENYHSQTYLFSNDLSNPFSDDNNFVSLPDGLYRLTLTQ